MSAGAVNPGPLYDFQASRPIRDRAYLDWIKTLPCAVCHQTRGIDPAHTGSHGLSIKASDHRAIPLCRRHHDEYGLGRRLFEQKYSLDIEALIRKLNEKPKVRIFQGKFVMTISGEEYALRPVQDGLKLMVRSAVSICRERFLPAA